MIIAAAQTPLLTNRRRGQLGLVFTPETLFRTYFPRQSELRDQRISSLSRTPFSRSAAAQSPFRKRVTWIVQCCTDLRRMKDLFPMRSEDRFPTGGTGRKEILVFFPKLLNYEMISPALSSTLPCTKGCSSWRYNNLHLLTRAEGGRKFRCQQPHTQHINSLVEGEVRGRAGRVNNLVSHSGT